MVAAGLVIIRPFPDGPRIVVLRQYRNWDLPKGLIDPGETALEAALREAREETGLTDIDFVWGTDSRVTDRYALRGARHGKVVQMFVGRSLTGDAYLPVSAALGRAEHHELRWVSFAAARSMLPARFHSILAWAETLADDFPASRPNVTAGSKPLPEK